MKGKKLVKPKTACIVRYRPVVFLRTPDTFADEDGVCVCVCVCVCVSV